jgi:hypothetical protein
MKKIIGWTGIVLNLALASLSQAQTTLTGDHVVTGNLNVGTSSVGKNLTVYGEIASVGGLFVGGGAYNEGTGNHVLATGGNGSEVYGNNSIIMGDVINSSGDYAFTVGYGCFNGGDYSVVMGKNSGGEAVESFTLGTQLSNSSFQCFVIGSHNVSDAGQDLDSWVSTDPLVVVGNGTGGGSSSNALVMRKNASMRTGGKIESKDVMRAPAGGGLGMGSFTAGQNPATLNSGLKYSGE